LRLLGQVARGVNSVVTIVGKGQKDNELVDSLVPDVPFLWRTMLSCGAPIGIASCAQVSVPIGASG
jgi:hypothetical protein